MFTQSDSLRKCLGGKTQIPCLSTNSKREWEMRSKSLTRGCTEEFIPTFSFLIHFQTIRKFDITQQTRIVQPYCIWKGITRDINADHQDTLPPTSQSVKKTKMANMASTYTSSRKKHSLYQICIFGTTLTTIATFNWEFMEKRHETGHNRLKVLWPFFAFSSCLFLSQARLLIQHAQTAKKPPTWATQRQWCRAQRNIKGHRYSMTLADGGLSAWSVMALKTGSVHPLTLTDNPGRPSWQIEALRPHFSSNCWEGKS